MNVSGRSVWHEVDGRGEPVVLLHGAFAGASSWSPLVPALTEAGFRLFRPERRGHAHTADVPGPLTYEVMADDTIEYLEQAVAGPASLIGWSDGAVVALLAALRRPSLVGRLVLIGQYYNSSGRLANGSVDQLFAAGPEAAMGALRTEYDLVSPDGPDHFPVVYDKIVRMLATEPELDLAVLSELPTPTLLMQGDRDDVKLSHTVDVQNALPDARIAVLPGTHLLPLESPATVAAVIADFLRGA